MPVVVVFFSPSPKFHTYSSIIVGEGVVESLASKLTVSPTLIDSWSAVISAIGVVDARPVQPAIVVNNRIVDNETALPACSPIMQIA